MRIRSHMGFRPMNDNHIEASRFISRSLGTHEPFELHALSSVLSGSKRSFRRILYGKGRSAILMHYASIPEENTYFAPISMYLQEMGIPVPRILAHDPDKGFLLMEDLGDLDLWTFRNAPWETRQKYYHDTLDIVFRLHAFPTQDFPSEKVPLTAGFGPELYRWERSYFLENFVGAVCGIQLSPSDGQCLNQELKALADRLDSIKPCLVHRDLQSRNIMIFKGKPYLIDFQGMRFGNLFYDLGSLLYDPYVCLADDERMELLDHYYHLMAKEGSMRLGWPDFEELFREASAQRLMQALGAYGFLGLVQELPDFLAHVPNGLANLIDATGHAKRLPLLNDLARQCNSVVSQAGN